MKIKKDHVVIKTTDTHPPYQKVSKYVKLITI